MLVNVYRCLVQLVSVHWPAKWQRARDGEGAFVHAGAPAQSNSCRPSRGKGSLYLSTVCSILGLVCKVAFRAEAQALWGGHRNISRTHRNCCA